MSKDTKNYQPASDRISNSTQPMLFNLSGLGKKKVEVKFTMEETSNDGGLSISFILFDIYSLKKIGSQC